MKNLAGCSLVASLLLAACGGGYGGGGMTNYTPPKPSPSPSAAPASQPMFMGTQGGAQTGFTPGWFQGKTVRFFYHTNNFFCRLPVKDGGSVGSTTQCEVGSDATINPRPADHSIPTLFVMTPVGFTPDPSTLHCPVVGHCINHPSTIDLSRLFGSSTANAPLPVHSHIIDKISGNWWGLTDIGVKDQDTWNEIVAGKSLSTVRMLQQNDPTQTHITGDILTNVYLYFQVQP